MDKPVRGLSQSEVDKRRAEGQVNRIARSSSRPVIAILRGNFLTLFNAILAAAVLLLLAVHLYRDALLTGGLILFSVVVGTVQELVAKFRLDRIALLSEAPVRVIRDGEEQEIRPSEVVLGDSLSLRRGDQVVADGRVVLASALEMDESLLSGEAEPARKAVGDSILSGSYCIAGSGVYIAERIGRSSYVQGLTSEGRQYRSPRTPIRYLLDRVLRILLFVVVCLSALQAVGFVLAGVPVIEAIRATAVLVTLVPQGLLLTSTVAYSLGALRVVRDGALVQQLNGVESLSHVDLICLDKTGTLTTGHLILKAAIPVSERPGLDEQELVRLVGAYAASDPNPNATVRALAVVPSEPAEVLGVVPFSSGRRWSALRLRLPNGDRTLLLGAADVLLSGEPATSTARLEASEREAHGQRVLLLGEAADAWSLEGRDDAPTLPSGLQPIGLLALEEELRPDAPAILDSFAAIGTRLKVISGDSPQTVRAVASQAGLAGADRAMAGSDLADLPPERLAQTVEHSVVFGRVAPQQKREIIRALRASGHYVAMIGDGVNDVLGLKEANLGIAMRGGAAAARGVADIVLLSDSFSALPAILREGRRIVNGITLVLMLFLIRDVATIELIVASSLANAPFPLLPPHAALIALLTVGIPALFVVVWAEPRPVDEAALRRVFSFVLWVGSTAALAILTTYLLALLGVEADIGQARTAVVTSALLSGLGALLLLQHPIDAPLRGIVADRQTVLLAAAMLLIYLVVLYVPGLQRGFELVSLSALDWLAAILIVAFWFGALRYVVHHRLLHRLLG